MRRFLLLLTLALGLLSAQAAPAETPTLTIYTYNSFTSEWGPGLSSSMPPVNTAGHSRPTAGRY